MSANVVFVCEASVVNEAELSLLFSGSSLSFVFWSSGEEASDLSCSSPVFLSSSLLGVGLYFVSSDSGSLLVAASVALFSSLAVSVSSPSCAAAAFMSSGLGVSCLESDFGLAAASFAAS